MRGKYSPTVTAAYRKNRDWHEKLLAGSVYDIDGYDSYGYDENDCDRAGNFEHDYLCDDEDSDSNFLYDQAHRDWGFDDVRPVRI